jgi:hypothetical protein
MNVEFIGQDLKRHSIMRWSFRRERLCLDDHSSWCGSSARIPGTKRFDRDTESGRALGLREAQSCSDLPKR